MLQRAYLQNTCPSPGKWAFAFGWEKNLTQSVTTRVWNQGTAYWQCGGPCPELAHAQGVWDPPSVGDWDPNSWTPDWRCFKLGSTVMHKAPSIN